MSITMLRGMKSLARRSRGGARAGHGGLSRGVNMAAASSGEVTVTVTYSNT